MRQMQRISSSLTDQRSNDLERKERKRSLASFLWDTFNKPPEERKLLLKVDAALLTFASFGSSPLSYLGLKGIN